MIVISDGQIVFEVKADDSSLGTALMGIEARLAAAGSVLSGMAAGTASAIGQAFGSIDLSGFGTLWENAKVTFSSILKSILGFSGETSQSLKTGFVDYLSDEFRGFNKTVNDSLMPPINGAVSVTEKLLSLFSKANSAAKSVTDNREVWDQLFSMTGRSAVSGAVQNGVTSSSAVSGAYPSVTVNVDAKLTADGYDLARVTLRNLDDAAGMM